MLLIFFQAFKGLLRFQIKKTFLSKGETISSDFIEELKIEGKVFEYFKLYPIRIDNQNNNQKVKFHNIFSIITIVLYVLIIVDVLVIVVTMATFENGSHK